MSNSPVTVTLVDDHDLAVAGLECLLKNYDSRVRLVDVRTALAHPDEVDVVLYEPMGQSAFSASMLRNLQAAAEAQAVVFSWAPGDQLPTTAATPYLSKAMTAAQLVVAMEDIVSGRGVPAPPQHTPAPVEAPAPEPAQLRTPTQPSGPAGSRLTPRELEILTLITAGLTNGEIGEQLGLSINSIKTYIRQAYRKIDVERRTQAVAWGMANGLVDEDAAVAV
ncbi:response regulator transcription factor [Nocardioides sp. GY 10127]|uniref:helix-turn-helix transcriptional regulator n=1 Tax=Nocardioides sp. GY 10127 TaxID=2569762 RepID=UPI0010A83B65|nr:response regulator transcription factor [Nocardioides sp. GY 10127]TIC79359.1 response regulator transcription factor [Nocardioides sp. GY 10127]